MGRLRGLRVPGPAGRVYDAAWSVSVGHGPGLPVRPYLRGIRFGVSWDASDSIGKFSARVVPPHLALDKTFREGLALAPEDILCMQPAEAEAWLQMCPASASGSELAAEIHDSPQVRHAIPWAPTVRPARWSRLVVASIVAIVACFARTFESVASTKSSASPSSSPRSRK